MTAHFDMNNQQQEMNPMTSDMFVISAKAVVCATVLKKYGEFYGDENLHVVWMAHVLGNKKAILIDSGANRRMYEVTYNAEADEMYMDIYEKQFNAAIPDFEKTMVPKK